MNNLGPRVIVKDDRDSKIGRGCQLYAAHFTPVVMDIMRHCVKALEAVPGVVRIVMTEGHRHIRDTRDLHEECKAIDFTAYLASGKAISDEQYRGAAIQAGKWLGSGYDVIAHDAGSGMHVHGEYDPKPKKATV